MKISPTLTCLLLLAAGACGGQDAVRTGAAPLDLPSRSLVEDLRVGSFDGPDALSTVGGVDVDEAGNIHVLQAPENTLRVFDASGDLVRVLGREGDGPAEFRRLSAAGLLGDTVWAADAGRRRLVFLSPDGRYLREVAYTLRLPFGQDIPDAVVPDMILREHLVRSIGPDRPLVDGTTAAVLDRRMPMPLPAESNAGLPGPVTFRVAVDGTLLDTVFDPGVVTPRLIHVPFGPSGSTMAVLPHPFPDDPLVSWDPTGRHVTLTERESYDGFIRVTRKAPGGDTLWTGRIPYRPVALTRAVTDSVLRARYGAVFGAEEVPYEPPFPSAEAFTEAVSTAVDFPPHWPPVAGVRVARNGWSVLETAPPAGGRTRYLVLDAEGTPREEWVGPSEVRVAHVDPPFVYGIVTDEAEVEYVIRYRIED